MPLASHTSYLLCLMQLICCMSGIVTTQNISITRRLRIHFLHIAHILNLSWPSYLYLLHLVNDIFTIMAPIFNLVPFVITINIRVQSLNMPHLQAPRNSCFELTRKPDRIYNFANKISHLSSISDALVKHLYSIRLYHIIWFVISCLHALQSRYYSLKLLLNTLILDFGHSWTFPVQ